MVKKNVVILTVAFIVIVLLSLLLLLRYLKGKKDQIAYLLSEQVATDELFELMTNYENQIVLAKKEEQNRISRELHDNIMNQIYGVRLHLGMLNNFDDAAKKEKRLYYIDMLREIEIEIRTLSHDLNEGDAYKYFDFTDILIKVIEEQNEVAETQSLISIADDIFWNEVPGIKRINLFRILQELMLNVNKHAKAKICNINLSLSFKNEIILDVKDDGVGFVQQKRSSSIGHKNIEKRVSVIKGHLQISSEIGKGTHVEVAVPIGD